MKKTSFFGAGQKKSIDLFIELILNYNRMIYNPGSSKNRDFFVINRFPLFDFKNTLKLKNSIRAVLHKINCGP